VDNPTVVLTLDGKRRLGIPAVLAAGLAAFVAVATYVLRIHALEVHPGLLRVQCGALLPEAVGLMTVSVHRKGQVMAQVTIDQFGRALVPDVAPGTYRVSIAYLDSTVAAETIEIREDDTATWIHTVPLRYAHQPPWLRWRGTPAAHLDSTDRVVASEVYALVVGQLIDRAGSRALIERETAHSGGLLVQNPAHGTIPVADSIRRALREPASRQVVWHHAGVFPASVTAISKAHVPTDAEGRALWRTRLGLDDSQRLHIFSLSRVFVSDEGTQAIVFAHDWCMGCGRGDVFWLARPSQAAAWRIERVDLTWMN